MAQTGKRIRSAREGIEVTKLYPLADAARAVQVSAARHLKGKLVFKLR